MSVLQSSLAHGGPCFPSVHMARTSLGRAERNWGLVAKGEGALDRENSVGRMAAMRLGHDVPQRDF